MTTTVLNTNIGKFEKKMSVADISDLVKKTDYNPKISEIEAKYSTTTK